MKHLWLILSSLPALFFACSIGDIAGSKGGSETTNGVYACVLNPDGKPAAGSAVRLRKSDYVSQPSMLAKKTIDRKELITDSTGSFLITVSIPENTISKLTIPRPDPEPFCLVSLSVTTKTPLIWDPIRCVLTLF